VPRGDPVHGIGIIGDVDAPTCQLVPESYRAGSGPQRGFGEGGEALGKSRRGGDERLPEPFARRRVKRREDLPTTSVEHGQATA